MLGLRPARLEDGDLLLAWVNSPDSLATKGLTREAIARDVHLGWLGRRLADAGTLMRVIELDGRPVGQVRLQHHDGRGHVVDIYVAPAARGGGVARRALAAAIAELRADAPDAAIMADVRLENAASRRLFERAGFVYVGADSEYATYSYPLCEAVP